MWVCHFVGEKMSIVLIRSPRVHDSKKGLELLFPPLFYSLKPNRIGLLPQYNDPSDSEDNTPISLKLIFSKQVYLFSTFSCDIVCIPFPTFMHIHLTCHLVNQYLSGESSRSLLSTSENSGYTLDSTTNIP